MNWVCHLPLRLILLVLAAITLVQFVLSAFAFLAASRDREGYSMLLPERVASVVDTVEGLPADRRARYLDVLQREDLLISMTAAPPEDSAQASTSLPAVVDVLAAYDASMAQRDVRVWIAVPEGARVEVPRLEALRTWSMHPMRIAVAMVSGEWLVFESRGYHPQSVFGWQPGFLAGLLGSVIAMVALLALWRSLGPMDEMSRRVSDFASNPRPVALEIRGAPEARKVAAAINDMQQRIADLIAEREVIFASVSHDLRTHLTRLRLRLYNLPEGETKAKSEADLDTMSAIIESHLLLARVNASEPRFDRIDLVRLVGQVAAARGLTFSRSGPDEPAWISADAILVVRALENLLSNACRHSDDVRLHLSQGEGVRVIDVVDAGPGIDLADRERLMRPFEAGSAGLARGPSGAGLGLAIVSRIAERHGARFALLDRPGGGLIARLAFPTASPQNFDRAFSDAELPDSGAVDAVGRGMA